MQNYNFDKLNDKEFEALVNDLISAREGMKVDRFKPGKDGGVDGRFFVARDKEVIIQSKHWLQSGVDRLIVHCRKSEAAKISTLNPHRYIFATSLPLSRANKKDIKSAFEPYLISEADILGKENLNDLLAKYPDVERKHYKLWLSSATVLEAMLNSALTGRSETKRDEILENTQLYVVTQNHELALSKLEEFHSVVITGEGGIGKTTLADQLAHHYVGQEYELCVIEDDLSEAESKFLKDKKQIFYYDDFLGRNYLVAIEGRKDSRILNFMDRISKDKDKRFILTSRTTVLNQGKLKSDLLNIKKIDAKEYEVTIESLGVFDRAKILYNHIWSSKLSESFIEQIYIDKRYKKIAKHANFNPRLISFITDPDRVISIEAAEYWNYILDTLDNPKDIWANVYDNQIDALTRIAVCLVVFNGQDLLDCDLRAAVRECALRDGIVSISSATSEYEKMVKAGGGSILRRTISSLDKGANIGLLNPSVADFVLRRHLSDKKALFGFFLHLNTEQSLLNLKSLKVNSSLDAESYYYILQGLSQHKLNLNLWTNHPSYFLRLIHLIIMDEESIKHCDGNEIRSILAAALKSQKSVQNINLLCQILVSAHAQQPEVFFEISENFIRLAALEVGSTEELNSLAKLRSSVFDESQGSELLDILRREAVSYWTDLAGDLIVEDNVLEDYMSDEDDEEAYQMAYDYISDALTLFEVEHDTISEIIDTIDFEQIKNDNIDVASRIDEETRDFVTGGFLESNDIDEAVDDLFDRE
ncbi:MAG: restriction endonuclease [Oceanicaulis sp.]|nr:restriction endonuclease [Oceanicaulis sp.]